jgi:phage terminase small subunit
VTQKPLSEKAARFCEEYLVDLNATKAAERAGYSAATAHAAGHRALCDARVQARISELKAARSERTGITADRVLAEQAAIAFFRINRVIGFEGGVLSVKAFSELGDAELAAISSIKPIVKEVKTASGESDFETVGYEVKFHDKQPALAMLYKHVTGVDVNQSDGEKKMLAIQELILGGLASAPKRRK